MIFNRLGDLIVLSKEKNSDLIYGVKDARGISINKIFIDTKANLENVSLRPYLVIRPKYFSYVTVTSRNGDKISIAYNNSRDTYIVSSSYISFYVKDESILLPEYLYIYFNRPEFDRISRFNSWGSARETFSWEDMCDMKIHVPSIEIQKKYVSIFNALLANQRAYDNGLSDIEIVSVGYIEKLKQLYKPEKIGSYITRGLKNTEEKINKVLGIGQTGFIKPQKTPNNSLKNYKIIEKGAIVYAPPLYNILSGAIDEYRIDKPVVCSPIYEVFYTNDRLNSSYLLMWLKRNEFKRYAEFYALGVRNTFDFDLMCEVEIPIPPIEIQNSIINIFNLYNERKNISENLKQKIKEICPILINGSTRESKGVV